MAECSATVTNAERRLVRILVGALCLSAAMSASAADLGRLYAEYSLTSWSKKDGLPSSAVYAAAEDPDGYLWLATETGVVRFDGARFTPWESLDRPTLPRRPARALCVARDGALWIGYGEPGGVSRVKDGHLSDYGSADGLGAGLTNDLVQDRDGTLWVGNRSGLFSFDNHRWQAWPAERGLPDGAVLTVYVDHADAVWVGTATGLYRRAAGERRFEAVEIVAGAPPISSGTTGVRDVVADAHGIVWMTDPRVGFRLVDRHGAPAKPADTGRGNRLLVDRRGNLWIGTMGQGLWRARLDSLEVDRATALIGLSDDGVTSLLEDRDGNIWAGTLDGLNRLTPHRMTPITDLGLVNSVDSTPDGIWVGSAGGLTRFPDGDPGRRAAPFRLAEDPITAIHADRRGTLWAATARQLFRIDGGRTTPVPLGDTPLHHILAVDSDGDDGLWLFDADRGLLRWRAGRVTPVALPVRGARTTSTYTDHSGRLWLALDNGPVVLVEHDAVRVLTAADGLDAGIYRPIYEDRHGAIWFGGTEGVTRYAGGRFATVRRSSRFPIEALTAIIEDASGLLWFGTAVGLVRMAPAEFDRAVTDSAHQVRYSLYDKYDGTAGTPRWYGSRSAARDAAGRLWFVGGRGVTVVDPRIVGQTHPPAPIRVERLAVNGRPLPAGEAALPSGVERLEIDYTATDLTSPIRTRFRYRLDGVDADWVDADIRHQAIYTNLSPGRYRFRVVANNDEGTWAEPGAALAFTIRPMFYQTIWFALLCGATIVLAVWGAWAVHTRQLRDQFAVLVRERARLSREIHDTLLQGLVGMALRLDAMTGDLVGHPELTSEFVRLRKEVEAYIREARQSIWDLRSPQLEAGDLPRALRDAGERAAASHHVEFSLSVRGTPERHPVDVEEQLMRIGQEAVLNAVRHSRARRVWMELQYDAGAVALRVYDDGSGFDPATADDDAAGHYGLRSMRERAQTLGAEFVIASHAGSGTCVETILRPTA